MLICFQNLIYDYITPQSYKKIFTKKSQILVSSPPLYYRSNFVAKLVFAMSIILCYRPLDACEARTTLCNN